MWCLCSSLADDTIKFNTITSKTWFGYWIQLWFDFVHSLLFCVLNKLFMIEMQFETALGVGYRAIFVGAFLGKKSCKFYIKLRRVNVITVFLKMSIKVDSSSLCKLSSEVTAFFFEYSLFWWFFFCFLIMTNDKIAMKSFINFVICF